MTVSTLQPFIRYCRRERHYKPGLRMIAADHRLFYCLEGKIGFTVGGKEYRLERGGLLYWHAGIPYEWHMPKGNPPELLGFNFDMTGDARKYAMPIPPESGIAPLEKAHFTDYPELNGAILLPGMHALRGRFLEIEKEYNERRLLWTEKAGAMLAELLLLALRELHAPDLSSGDRTEEILAFIHRSYHLPLTNKMLGEQLCYHPNYINRLIVAATGSSLHRYLLDCRIRAAITLLETTALPIAEVGESVGFGDASHFSKCFRRLTGRSPSEYRGK